MLIRKLYVVPGDDEGLKPSVVMAVTTLDGRIVNVALYNLEME